MTSFHSIPEELMRMIFENLKLVDLKNCQKVCRSWYSVAHLQIMKEVTLNNQLEIQQFIDSIDYNPKPLYLKAVKDISLDLQEGDSTNFHLDERVLEKVFFRFPNLRNVGILGQLDLLDGFDDKICETFLECCPKLDKFEAYINGWDQAAYFTNVYEKIRLVLTMLDMEEREPTSGDIVQFMTSFPRLQRIQGYSYDLKSFQAWLPILEKLSNINSITILWESRLDDDLQEIEQLQEDEGERYLASKTSDVQHMLVDKLSKITELDLSTSHAFCTKSIKFASKYLTGLRLFRLSSHSNNLDWTQLHNESLRNEILDLFCSAKVGGTLEFYGITLATLALHLPTVMNKIFQSPVSSIRTTSNTIKFNMTRPRTVVPMKITSTPVERVVNISVGRALDLTTIMITLSSNPIHNNKVDEFVFSLSKRHQVSHDTAFSQLYLVFYTSMPSLKTKTLDIPASIAFELNEVTSTLSYLEELTLRPISTTNMQAILDLYYVAFPNLKRLNLYYFCGAFDVDLGEFVVRLPKYSLQKLVLDATFVKTKMIELWTDEVSVGDDFLVLQVEILNTGMRYLYKIQLDLSTIIRVNDSDLEGKVRGKDYFRVKHHYCRPRSS